MDEQKFICEYTLTSFITSTVLLELLILTFLVTIYYGGNFNIMHSCKIIVSSTYIMKVMFGPWRKTAATRPEGKGATVLPSLYGFKSS